MYNQPAQLLDSDADNKMLDADLALQALGGDHVAFGHLTTTITVSDLDPARVDEKLRAVERTVNGLGFTVIREGVNAVEARPDERRVGEEWVRKSRSRWLA